MSQNEPKWTFEVATEKGKQAIELVTLYRSDIENRYKPGEIEKLQSSVTALDLTGKAGQSQALVKQKAQTLNKGGVALELQNAIVSIRNMAKAAKGSSDILMAFGVGLPASAGSQPQLIASANLIISGFEQHRDWAQNEAGILEEDIEEIQELLDQLTGADATLGKKKFARKTKTVDKNTLQRTVEDLVTKTSVIGINVFRKKNKAIVPLFEALIPGSGGNTTTNDNPPVPEPATTVA